MLHIVDLKMNKKLREKLSNLAFTISEAASTTIGPKIGPLADINSSSFGPKSDPAILIFEKLNLAPSETKLVRFRRSSSVPLTRSRFVSRSFNVTVTF